MADKKKPEKPAEPEAPEKAPEQKAPSTFDLQFPLADKDDPKPFEAE